MPSKSKSQQRLMAAAEHGADFPMARKLRQTMTHEQLHDFAVGPMAAKPEHVEKPKRALHPALAQRARMVKEAHAHLKSAIPNYHRLPARQRMMAAQHHVNLRLGKVK